MVAIIGESRCKALGGIAINKKFMWRLVPFCVVAVGVAVFVDFELHGTPWGKSAFRKEADQYLRTTYNLTSGYTSEVVYSFEEMEYISYVTLPNGQTLAINRDYFGDLTDNNVTRYEDQQLSDEVSKKLEVLYPSIGQSHVRATVMNEQWRNTSPDQQPLHSLPNIVKNKTQIHAMIDENDEKKENFLAKMFQFVTWVKDSHINSDLLIYVPNELYLHIRADRLALIHSPQDLAPYLSSKPPK